MSDEHRGHTTGGPLKRRGLIAGAASLMAAGLAKLAGPERAEAGHGPADAVTPLHLSFANSTTASTEVTTSGIRGLGAYSTPSEALVYSVATLPPTAMASSARAGQVDLAWWALT